MLVYFDSLANYSIKWIMETSDNQEQGKHSFDDASHHGFHFDIKKDLTVGLVYLRRFFKNILGIKEGTDIPGTIEGIQRDISFRGHKAWILMFSIFIASIGLNTNSTPVIIGAMLISPLMGPILGVGLAVGVNDFEMLVRSLKSFAIAIGISLVTSTLYFLIIPLDEVQSELLARTKPTLLDVLIAIFGGLSGIVAGSRKEKSNVIPGVAIATALMPPLCTAGFGLANWNLNFFFGAFYLFFLNSVFISVSTFFVVRLLHFPKKVFINHKRELRIKRYMAIFLILVIIPSIILFWDVIKLERFNTSLDEFISENLENDTLQILKKEVYFSDTLSVVEIYMYPYGGKLSDEQIKHLNKQLVNYGLVKRGSFWRTGNLSITDRTVLKIHQSKQDIAELDTRLRSAVHQESMVLLQDIYKRNEEVLKNKDKKIEMLEEEVIRLSKRDTVPFHNIEQEIKVLYKRLDKFAYAPTIEVEQGKNRDTIPTFLVHWGRDSWPAQREAEGKEMALWLKAKLGVDTIRVITY